MEGRILIAYFSRKGYNYVNGDIVRLPVGNTEWVASIIQGITGGDIFKIEPLIAYPEDYHECVETAKKEYSINARPDLVKYPEGYVENYSTIILGYPNWCGTMPMPVWTFIDMCDFSGKIILPFCTHEGGGMGRSESDIRKICPSAILKRGISIKGDRAQYAEKGLRNWLCRAQVI